MTVMYVVTSVAIILVCIAIIAMILMQQKKASGISASLAGMGAQQSYWDKHKNRSMEGKLELYTKLCGGVLIALVLVFPFLANI